MEHSDQSALFENRSASFTTTSDLARRLRSLLTPPRTRRSTDGATRGSPTHVSRATIATSTPATRKSVMAWGAAEKDNLKLCKSCGDIGKLDDIFEPRMAPYTPPNNLWTQQASEEATPVEQERREMLESSLFEPRNAPCTPPLVRRTPTQTDGLSSSHSDLQVKLSPSQATETDRVPNDVAPAGKFTVEQLQSIMSDLRTRAEESSAQCAKQLHDTSESQANSQDSLLTVREVGKIASVGSLQNFQRSFSGRSHTNRFLALGPRARSATVC